jgi:hypothetical protein
MSLFSQLAAAEAIEAVSAVQAGKETAPGAEL